MKSCLEIDPRSLTIQKSGNKNHKQFLDKNSETIIFQTEPCKIVAIKKEIQKGKSQKNFILALDCGIDMFEWFKIVQERLEAYFINFRPFMERDLLVKTDDSTMGFNRHKDFLPLSKLEINDSIIVILTTTGIWSDDISSNLVWKVKQIVKL